MENRKYELPEFSSLSTAARPEKKAEPQKRKTRILQMPPREVPIQGRMLSTRQLLKYAAVTAVVVVVVGIVLSNKVRINELNSAIAAQEVKLSEADQKYSQLGMEARAKVNIRDVEEYATNELGMQLPEEYQVETVELAQGDKTVIHEGAGAGESKDMTREWTEIRTGATNILAYLG